MCNWERPLSDRVGEVVEGLQALRHQHPEAKGAYWAAYCRLVQELCVADEVWVIQVTGNRTASILGHAGGATEQGSEHNGEVPAWFAMMLERAQSRGFSISPDGQGATPGARLLVPMTRIADAHLVLRLNAKEVARANELMLRARLVADMVPAGESDGIGVGDALLNEYLHLVAHLSTHERFATAAYALVNGLVGQDETIGLAAIGWRDGPYIKVQALSHHDRFERRTEWVKRIEAALEEAADQDRVICYPDADADTGHCVNRAHDQLQIQSGAAGILTLPVGDLTDDGELVLLVMSYEEPLGHLRERRLQLFVELIYPMLTRLRRREASLLRRARERGRALGSWLLGSDRLVLKTGMLVISVMLLYGIFGTLPHRVEGSARLVTDEVRVFSAPFEGRVEEAAFNSGEPVQAGEVLARMDIEDLLLQRGELQADLRRQVAEGRRARASGELVDAEIASARIEQARARLARIESRLEQAQIVSSFDGIVVEGERQMLLGRPTRQGDALYRLARLEGMYLRIDIPQESVHFISPGETGEFVFLSRPGEALPIEVSRIVPMARVEPGQGAFFEVIAEPLVASSEWWRPGMEGVARIDQGRRSVIWVLGHRLINRLRVWLWW